MNHGLLSTVSIVLLTILPIVLIGCGAVPSVPDPPSPIIEANSSIDDFRLSGIHLEWMDTSMEPEKDFFTYACGEWVNSTDIPEGWSSYSGFDSFNDELNEDLLSLLTASRSFDCSCSVLAVILFQSGLDIQSIEAADIVPLEEEFALIDGIQDAESFSYALGHLQLIGVTPFFRIHRPIVWELLDRNYLYLRQTSLGLSDGFVNYSDVDEGMLTAEEVYIDELLVQLGYCEEDARSLSERIINLEQRLLENAMSDYEMRNFQQNYNTLSQEDLADQYGGIIWDKFMDGLGITFPSQVVVGQLDFFSEINSIIEESDWELIRAYLKWALLAEFSPAMSSRFAMASDRFYESVSGSLDRTREYEMLSVVRRELPDVLGAMYLEGFFPDSTRQRVQIIIANLKVAYDTRLRGSTWLDEDTRAHALAKLSGVRFALGGPDAPQYYGALGLSENNYLSNLLTLRRLRMSEHLSHIDEPLSDDVWFQEAFNANRWSLPSMNTVLLPAAGINELLKMENDDAYNYGAFGSTIAHEITHLFDRNGRIIDEQCRQRNWWTNDDLNEYEVLIASLNGYYETLGREFEMELDGEYMFDENFADVMGLRVAFDAYQISLGGKTSSVKDGFTGEQRLFLANAQKWRVNYTPEGLRASLQGWHSPGPIRAIAPASLCEDFYENFTESGASYFPTCEKGLELIW